jgi:hypothetical protein
MKITLVKSNLEAQLTGGPAVVSFTITQKQLTAFNRSLAGPIRYAPSFIDAIQFRFLPCPEARQWLRRVYSDQFGIMSGTLTMQHLRTATFN